MSRIFIIDATSHITNHTVPPITDRNGVQLNTQSIQTMVWACNILLPRVAKAWNVTCPTIVYYTGQYQPQPNDWVFKIIDTDPNTPGAEAYHTEENDKVDGYILAKTIVDNGGFILSDKSISSSSADEVYIHGSQQSTIAGALFHELAEALMDSTVNSWWQANGPLTIIHSDGTTSQSNSTFSDGSTYCSGEICDPVQQNFVVIKCGVVDVALSDFILPAWKDTQNKTGPFNYIKSLNQPFFVDIGGYSVVLDSTGSPQQVFSKAIPDWIKGWKAKAYRSIKRSYK